MNLKYEFDNERPIYVQLLEKLRLFIIIGEYKLGERLPSVRDLALLFKINPNTVQKALNTLEEEKLIYTERTNGKFVTNNKKLVDNIKNKIAFNISKKYISDMNSLGINLSDSISYLEGMNKNENNTRM